MTTCVCGHCADCVTHIMTTGIREALAVLEQCIAHDTHATQAAAILRAIL